MSRAPVLCQHELLDVLAGGLHEVSFIEVGSFAKFTVQSDGIVLL